MPTVLRIDGLRVVVYPNDHPPAHVHVIGSGWTIVIELSLMKVRSVVGCGEVMTRQVLRRVGEHRAALLAAWRRYHV